MGTNVFNSFDEEVGFPDMIHKRGGDCNESNEMMHSNIFGVGNLKDSADESKRDDNHPPQPAENMSSVPSQMSSEPHFIRQDSVARETSLGINRLSIGSILTNKPKRV